MGEASRRRAALGAAHTTAIPAADVQKRVYEAVHSTLEAFGAPRFGDCIYHAAATVGALRAAGIDAQVVGGAVWWAVGPGPADTATHGYRNGRISEHLWSKDRFPGYDRVHLLDCHAVAGYRVAGASYIVDMTTYQLPEKARLQSESDGMPMRVTMQVDPYYWGRLPPQRTWNNAKPGDWCFTPVDGLGDHITMNTSAEHILKIAEIAYQNPGSDLSVFDLETGADAAEMLADQWAAFRAPQPLIN